MNMNLCKYLGIFNIYANPKDDYMFAIICKNACSYIKYITLLNNNIEISNNNLTSSDYHGKFIKSNLAYHEKDKDYCTGKTINGNNSKEFDPSNYKMIYIWRDPFERFISLYNDKIKNDLWFSYKNAGINKNISFEDFLSFAEYNITNSNGLIEEHIRPQSDYYGTKIDYVVPINNLKSFILEKNISNDISLINSYKHSIEEYNKYRDRIYKLYERDLDILNIYKDKIYQ